MILRSQTEIDAWADILRNPDLISPYVNLLCSLANCELANESDSGFFESCIPWLLVVDGKQLAILMNYCG